MSQVRIPLNSATGSNRKTTAYSDEKSVSNCYCKIRYECDWNNVVI